MTARALRQSGAGRLCLRQLKAISKPGFWFNFEADPAQKQKDIGPLTPDYETFFLRTTTAKSRMTTMPTRGPQDLKIGRNEHGFADQLLVFGVGGGDHAQCIAQLGDDAIDESGLRDLLVAGETDPLALYVIPDLLRQRPVQRPVMSHGLELLAFYRLTTLSRSMGRSGIGLTRPSPLMPNTRSSQRR